MVFKEIDTRIDMTLHPNVVHGIEGYEQHKEYLTPTEGAFRDAYQGIQQVYQTRELVEKNTAWNADQKTIQIAQFADKVYDRVMPAFDRVTASLDKQIAYYDKELSVPLDDNRASAFAAEIRSHVKGLSTDERMKFMMRAINDKDETSLGAVLGAPGYLSGTTPEMHAVYVRQYRVKTMPEKAARLKALQDTKALIEKNAGQVLKDIEKAVGASYEKVGALRKVQDAAAKALKA